MDNSFNFYIGATEKGLCFVGSNNQKLVELERWRKKYLPSYKICNNDEKLQIYVQQFIKYLKGELNIFTFSIDLYGTEFQLLDWNTLKEIPYGRTYSYSDIATILKKPKAYRAVGAAVGANPILITVPCHRVIGKNGNLTGFRGGV